MLKGSCELQTRWRAGCGTLVNSCLASKCQLRTQLENENTVITAGSSIEEIMDLKLSLKVCVFHEKLKALSPESNHHVLVLDSF